MRSIFHPSGEGSLKQLADVFIDNIQLETISLMVVKHHNNNKMLPISHDVHIILSNPFINLSRHNENMYTIFYLLWFVCILDADFYNVLWY